MKTRSLLKGVIYLLAIGLSLWVAEPVAADGFIIIDPPIPGPPPKPEPWLTIRYHRVTVTIEDQVAVTEIDQAFLNEHAVAVEGTYLFPLPPGAVVDDFTMWVDGEPMEGEILPAEEAREIYEGYVRRQQDPALLEYVGRDTIRARVFPIPAGEERRVRIRYTQVLPIEDQLLYYRYPLDTERFSAAPLEQVSIRVNLKAESELRAIYSPSHQDDLIITREGAHQAALSYEARDVRPNRDFELYASTADGGIGADLLSYQRPGEDGTFMLLLSPALDDQSERVARDVILILDTSGSMEGDKLDQARAGLTYVLEHLNPEDRFNVITFSSQTRAFAGGPVPRDRAAEAVAWIRSQAALGGTNIHLALSEALAQVDAERPTAIVFLTDGLPTEGLVENDQILDSLTSLAPASVRVFPFGVGYDVNVLLLDRLAENHRGRPTYVEPDERIDERISALYAKMQSPVLTDISLDFGGVSAYDLYPSPLPDLFAGTQLVVVGRFRGSGPQRITLSGRIRGIEKAQTYPVDFDADPNAGFLPRLWAARKIGYLLTQIRLHGERDEWVEAVTELSLKHGIITPYTSFLIEEPEMSLSAAGRERAADTFKEELGLMPQASVGEEAVEDAKLRHGLGGADAPVAGGGVGAESETDPSVGDRRAVVRYAGAHTFICEADRCTDTRYVPDDMQPETVPFLSAAYERILAEHPSWADVFSLAQETIFVDDNGKAFRFVLDADAAASEPGEAEPAPPDPTPTPAAGPGETPSPTQPSDEPTRDLCAAPFLLLVPVAAIALKKSFG